MLTLAVLGCRSHPQLLRRAAEASEVSRAFYTHPAGDSPKRWRAEHGPACAGGAGSASCGCLWDEAPGIDLHRAPRDCRAAQVQTSNLCATSDPPEQPSPVEVGTSKVLAQENERLRQQLSQVSALLTRREAAPVTAVPAGAALNANAQDAPTLADPSSSVQRAQNVVIAKLQEKVRSYKAKAEGLEESNAALRGELIALKQERRLDPAQHQDCVPLLQHSKLMQAQMDSLQANMAAEAQAALKSAESEARAHYEAVLSQERAASEAELADRAASLEALRTSEARCQEERRAAYTSLSEHQVADVQTRQRLAAAAQETKACLAALQGFVAATKTEYTTACQAFMQAMATLGGKLVSHVASADVGGLVSLIRQLEEDKEEAQVSTVWGSRAPLLPS